MATVIFSTQNISQGAYKIFKRVSGFRRLLNISEYFWSMEIPLCTFSDSTLNWNSFRMTLLTSVICISFFPILDGLSCEIILFWHYSSPPETEIKVRHENPCFVRAYWIITISYKQSKQIRF